MSYLAEQIRRDDHDRYLCALFAPGAAREDLFALYAFNAEIAKVRESVSEQLIGRMKLQWWRDLIAAIYEGREAPKGNPVVQGLAGIIERQDLAREDFDTLLDTRERDIGDEDFADVADLESYADGTSARLTSLALQILGVQDEGSRAAGRHVGIAWALTGLMRAVLFQAKADRVPLPQDLLAGASLTPHDVQERRNAARLGAVIAQVAHTARAHLDKARTYRAHVDKRALPALLPATLADSYLQGLERRKYDVFDPRHALQRPAVGRLIWNGLRGRF
ncbi:MAG: squalene/phytoene synthase family protein [Rhodospirillaceae bacterium]|nr:squalene/phytoene synthase family protein [Rhodospirillaceae bacterium]